MAEQRVITVSQLNNYIKRLIDNDPHLKTFYVKGELSNVKIHYTGHIYLTLKDENSLLRGVMFKSSAMKLKFKPEDGMKVIVRGRVSVFERDGQYQIYIDDMLPDGVGALYVALEQLKFKLSEEGLFLPERKKTIPRMPEAVGLITSPTGAAVRDMIHILKRRFPLARVYLYPAQVQGEGASGKLKRAIEYFNSGCPHKVDTIIIGRGGGSIEELWAFNEEETVRAIAASDIPIISAVGHETDFTLSDLAADLRAPTPSAAAEVAVPDQRELLSFLQSSEGRAESSLKKKAETQKARLEALKGRRVLLEPALLTNMRFELLDRAVLNLKTAGEKIIAKERLRFEQSVAKTEALSPLKVLARGYSITRAQNEAVVKNVSEINVGEKISTRVKNGEIFSEVTEIKKFEI